jgi:putative phosphoribosyl transferase
MVPVGVLPRSRTHASRGPAGSGARDELARIVIRLDANRRGTMTTHDEVTVQAHDIALPGVLDVPERATGVVLIARDDGGGHPSMADQLLVRVLHRAGLATLLVDLLTADEAGLERGRGGLRDDVELLASRLIGVTHWLRLGGAPGLPIAYLGGATSAAAALVAAAREPYPIGAVVSRGGRPDLAGAALEHVRAPTLLIVGSDDGFVVARNQDAALRLRVAHAVEVVPGAGHRFEEPGAHEEVAGVATAWLTRHLTTVAHPAVELGGAH